MGCRVGIVGANTAVGKQMISALEKRNLAISELKLFDNVNDRKVMFKDQEIEIQTINEKSFNGLDYVLGATSNEEAMNLKDLIVSAGCVFIDSSGAFRSDLSVPLVVPEINGEDAFLHKGIIANPNCVSIMALMVMNPINQISKIKRVHASTYQAASGGGVKGIQELVKQIQVLAQGGVIVNDVFAHQLALNLIPCIGDVDENGYTKEEMKLQNEGRRILHNDDLLVDCTCVRVPVVRAHSVSLNIECEDELDLNEVIAMIKQSPGLLIKDNLDYPMPLSVTNQDLIEVGRIRKDVCSKNSISLFLAGDQMCKGSSVNVVQILEFLINN